MDPNEKVDHCGGGGEARRHPDRGRPVHRGWKRETVGIAAEFCENWCCNWDEVLVDNEVSF